MPLSYSLSLRRQVAKRLRDGEPVADIAVQTGISSATSFRWKAQALVDAGVRDGVPSVEADESAAAHLRIARLEAELALTRDACALFDAQVVTGPKGKAAIVAGLIARGHSARSACRVTGLNRSTWLYYQRNTMCAGGTAGRGG